MDILRLDNSKASMFRTCRRKFYLSEILDWKSNYGSTALRYGSTWHAILEGYYEHILTHGWGESANALAKGIEKGKEEWIKESEGKIFNDDYRTFDACCESFLRYLSFFANDFEFVKIIGTEKKFECPIIPESLEEEAKLKLLPPVIFTGKIDLQLMMSDGNWIQDHKTTGANIDQQAFRLNRSGQLLGYSYASNKVFDFVVTGCLVGMHYLSARKSTKTGDYGSLSVDFRRIPMIFNSGDMKEWKRSFIDTCLDVYRCMEENNFVMNFDSCYQYGPCSYTRICEQHKPINEVNFEGYHIEHWDVLQDD